MEALLPVCCVEDIVARVGVLLVDRVQAWAVDDDPPRRGGNDGREEQARAVRGEHEREALRLDIDIVFHEQNLWSLVLHMVYLDFIWCTTCKEGSDQCIREE